MNILQVLPELSVGGVETGTLDLAGYLVKSGHKAVVVSAGGDLVKDLEASGAIHYQLPVHKKSLFSILKSIPQLAEIIKKEEIQVVHARSRVPAWIAYFACRRTGAVFITTCHGYYKKHFFSSVMGWAKRIIVPSNVIAQNMIKNFGAPYERIRLIPRSVDLEKFQYVNPDKKKKDSFNVGIIGRLTPIKGHLYFIRAMARVAPVIPDLKIWIVGDAPASKSAYKEQLRILVRRLGLSPYTDFLGMRKDIPEVLRHLDLLVLATTTQEAFGRVIIEAHAAGVPVVATAVGGVNDIIDHEKTGLLVPPADPASMSEAVIRVFKDGQLAKSLAENAYKKVKEKYNVEFMAKSTLDVYKEALGNYRLLIIKFSSLGDLILSTAAIRAIKESLPAHKITFLTGEESKEVLLRCPYINELLVCDFKGRDKGIGDLFRLGKNLRARGFDIVVDLQNNRKSHMLSMLTLAPQRYGYDNNKFGFLLNRRIRDEKPAMDPVTHQFRILKMLGIELKGSRLELWPAEEDKRYVEEFLKSEWVSQGQKIVGINISASSRWATKVWPVRHIIKLCEELARRDIRVVVTGGQKDLPAAEKLAGSVKNVKIINACAKTTVNQLACLVEKCSVYISCDSAPLHVAAAVGTPFVALFGPTDPARHLVPVKNYVVIKKDLICSPCYKPECKKRRCMELIMPEEVLEGIDKLLKIA